MSEEIEEFIEEEVEEVEVVEDDPTALTDEELDNIADTAIAETSMTGIVLSGIWLNTPSPSPATAPPSIIAANPARYIMILPKVYTRVLLSQNWNLLLP